MYCYRLYLLCIFVIYYYCLFYIFTLPVISLCFFGPNYVLPIRKKTQDNRTLRFMTRKGDMPSPVREAYCLFSSLSAIFRFQRNYHLRVLSDPGHRTAAKNRGQPIVYAAFLSIFLQKLHQDFRSFQIFFAKSIA